jgi:hypothetical protein
MSVKVLKIRISSKQTSLELEGSVALLALEYGFHDDMLQHHQNRGVREAMPSLRKQRRWSFIPTRRILPEQDTHRDLA